MISPMPVSRRWPQFSIRTLFLAVTNLILLAGSAHADDWPQWRGPNRDGVWNESGIAKHFPPGELKVRWRAPVGPGWSSPVVAGGKVYLNDAELIEMKAKERVHCFEASTGKTLWTYSYDVAYPDWAFDKPGRGPTSTPIVQDDKLYTVGNKGDLHCLDAAKGGVLWRRNLEKEYDVQEFAFNASPLIEGDLLILPIGSYPGTWESRVIALDKSSGKEVWNAPNEGLTNSSPIVITAGGKRQLIVWTQEALISLNPTTGDTFWQEPMKTAAASAVCTPVLQDDLLLVSGLMLRLDAEKPAASILWPARRTVLERVLSNTSTPLIQGEYVFSARSSGELVCLEKNTGKEVWMTDKATALKNGASIHLTPISDSVLLYTDEGNLIRAELSGQGYKEFSRTTLLKPVEGQKSWPPPAFANGCVFARNDEELVCASLREGQ